MNDLKKIIEKYKFHIYGIKEKGNVKIIDTNKGKYVLKKKKRDDLKDIFKYLNGKQFSNFVNTISDEEDEYDIYPFLEDNYLTEEEKILEIAHLMSYLHNKTTTYRKVHIDDIKKFYEQELEKVNYFEQYYESLRIQMEEEYFLSPSKYLFLRNYSFYFQAIYYAKNYLEKWYEIVKRKESRRVVLTHNQLDTSHLLENNIPYIISWEKAKINMPLYDFYSFYNNNYQKIDMREMFSIYNARYELLEEEKYLLFYQLLLPKKIEWHEKEIENVKIIYENQKYLKKTFEFILEKNSKYSKSK